MTPRAVLMKKAIGDIIGPEFESELGNIIGPVCRKGWSNNFSEWFLDGPDKLGNPTMFKYSVHSWLDGQPRWAQRPVKLFGVGYNAIMYPQADSLTPPPTSNLFESGYSG